VKVGARFRRIARKDKIADLGELPLASNVTSYGEVSGHSKTSGRSMPKCLLCLIGLLLTGISGFADEPKWRYVADVSPGSSVRPIFRTITLSSSKPDDVIEAVPYRGRERKYAQIRYGSDDSRRVVVVFDFVDHDDFDLYVDANRNRAIEVKDKVAGTGKERTARLDVEITRGLQVVHERRLVRWRLGTTRKTVSLATLGSVEGSVSVAGKKCRARRVDGNANGFFADAADRLWIDLNQDHQWDALSEQFPFTPVLTLDNQRYSVRGDASGSRLTLEPLTGEGRIRLHLSTLPKDTLLLKVDVMLTGEDGSAFALNAADTPLIVPIGRYAIGSVVLTVQSPGGSLPVHFLFSRVGVDADTRWRELKKGQELTLDPIGKLRFGLSIDKSQRTCKPRDVLSVQPQLFTTDNLLINSCSFGDAEEVSRNGSLKHCEVNLRDANKLVLDTHASGFA
jgi:hypothetical protein